MAMVDSPKNSMEDEESFIILGSTTPTPSMENFTLPPDSLQPASIGRSEKQESSKCSPVSKMEASTQLESSTYSLLANGENVIASVAQLQQGMSKSLSESSKALLVASAESIQSQKASPAGDGKGSLSLRSIENKENVPSNPMKASQQLATASFIIGETQSILHQFPSLAQSHVSIEEVQLLQKLSLEHSQLKESLQRANIAMRKNFTSLQQLQDETRARCAEQEGRIAAQQKQIEQITAENGKLVDENKALTASVATARDAAATKGAELENVRTKLQAEVEEISRLRQVERKSAQDEIDELRKACSERQSIIQNLAKKIEDLELQIKGFVVVQNNKPEACDGEANFVAADVHKKEIKALQRQMSVVVAKNLEFEDMRHMYVEEIDCLKANVKAAEQIYTQTRVEMQQLYDTVKDRDGTIATLREEVRLQQEKADILAAQSEIFQKDFEAERDGRQELASEKSRILAEFEVLQRQNAELSAKVSMTETEREQVAQRAAQMVQVATSSEESVSTSQTNEDTDSEPRSLLRCPLCLKGYKEFSTLQSHAAYCMGTE